MRQRLMVMEVLQDAQEVPKLRELIRREVDRLLDAGHVRMHVVAVSEQEKAGRAQGFCTLQTPEHLTVALFALYLTIYQAAKREVDHPQALKRWEAVELRARAMFEEATRQPVTT